MQRGRGQSRSRDVWKKMSRRRGQVWRRRVLRGDGGADYEVCFFLRSRLRGLLSSRISTASWIWRTHLQRSTCRPGKIMARSRKLKLESRTQEHLPSLWSNHIISDLKHFPKDTEGTKACINSSLYPTLQKKIESIADKARSDPQR